MFFFFPFYTESQASANGGGGASYAKTLPLLPAPGSARTSSRAKDRASDFGDFAVDLLRQVISAFTSSLTALGNRANALFAQLTAALAFDRVGRDTASFINTAFSGFGLPSGARPSPFGAFRPNPVQDAMSFSPFLMQGFNPSAMNPWAALSEGMNFWTSMWMPAAPQRNPFSFGNNTAASPFTAKVTTPGGFSWGFAWGQ
jgi:hypothetical protein